MTSPTTDARARIGNMVITPRALPEYRSMFGLTDADLVAGPILDCPGGGSPFGAQVRARGGTAVSVDPAYSLPRQELGERLRQDLARIASWTATGSDNFDWSYLGSPAALNRYFDLAADLFLHDYQPASERYVAAALPKLPFEDGAFRLSLCSHLLFCHPEYLNYDDHLAAVCELMRVTSGELRVYPLVDTTGNPYPHLDELREALAAHRVSTEIRAAECVYVTGGNNMLACRWRT